MKTLNSRRFGFTLVEIIISASIALSLFGTAYGLLTRGFFTGEKNLKNLSAIQEMSLIIYSMRLDLKAFHEKEGDESTYLNFNAAKKKLSFSVVKNIKPDGTKEYCRISYSLSGGGSFTKNAEWTEKSTAQKSVMQLAGNGGIKEFSVKLFDESGAEIIDRKGPYKKPAFMELKIGHRASEKLEAGVVLRSLYPDDSSVMAGRFWMTGFKTDSSAAKVPKMAGIIGGGSVSQPSVQKPLEISESSPDGAGKGDITTVVNLMGLSNEINSSPLRAAADENAGKNAQGVRVIDVNTPEYRANYAYVKNLYKTILERDLDQNDNDFYISGVPYWVARLHEGRSKEEVKNCIMDSEERFILTCFKKYCKRAPTNIESEIFTSRLRGDSVDGGGGGGSETNGTPAGGGLQLAGSKDYAERMDQLLKAADGVKYMGSDINVLPGGSDNKPDVNVLPDGSGGESRAEIEKEIARMAAKNL